MENTRPVTPEYSVVIPVFNSTESLTELCKRLRTVLSGITTTGYEIILVDDGSANPETWPLIHKLSNSFRDIKGVRLTRNFGKQAALIAGFTESRGKYIITMDDDLQHAPEDIPVLLREKHHMVVAGRFAKKEHGILKRFFSNFNDRAETLLIGKPSHVRNSPFKMIRREIIDGILQIKTPYPSISALLFYVTRDAVNVTVSHNPRLHGETGFTFRKMLRVFLNMAFHNSAFFLKAIASTGFTISLASFAIGLIYLVKKLTVGIPVPGYTSLITVVSFLGGLTLSAIGVLGEYLIRIINGVESKPPFVIERKVCFTDEQ
jgi:glycosyltransferase involved in cell wall biosynthesis